MTADQIIASARGAIGTPFRHQGRVVGRALDCAGLILHVCSELGISYTDVPAYGHTPHRGLLEATLESQPVVYRVYEKQPGDILLMKFTGEPQHLAIYAGGTIIHSYANARKVCEHDLTKEWDDRIVRIYRFKGLT